MFVHAAVHWRCSVQDIIGNAGPEIILLFLLNRHGDDGAILENAPTVGLEPTTTRLRALRSAD